jgi:hypothetical protein
MAGAQMKAAKAALVDLFDGLQDHDGMSLYKFSSTIEAVFPIRMKKDHKDYKGAVATITAGGRTVLYDAIVSGMAEAKKSHEWNRKNSMEQIQRLVVLTDGEDACSKATLDEAVHAIQKPGFPTCKVFIVAVGAAIQSEDVLRLKHLSNVEVVPAVDAAGIAGAFHKLKLCLLETTTIETTNITEQVSINGRKGGKGRGIGGRGNELGGSCGGAGGGGGGRGEGGGGVGGGGSGGDGRGESRDGCKYGPDRESRKSPAKSGGGLLPPPLPTPPLRGKGGSGRGPEKPKCTFEPKCTNTHADHRSNYHHSCKPSCFFGENCTKHNQAHDEKFSHAKA